jgi:DNA-directed RNA polymerase specialized sigma24 family protein
MPRFAVESSTSEIDLRLLQRIATRDEAALAELYDRHSRLTYSVIMHILRSPSDAEEVLQETFVRMVARGNLRRAAGVSGRLADTYRQKSRHRPATRPPRAGERRRRSGSPLRR